MIRVYNIDKTEVLSDYNLDSGYLQDDILEIVIPYKPFIQEEGHYEVIKEYPNGGKDVVWIVDIEGQDEQLERVEVENIQVYIPYTQAELDKQAEDVRKLALQEQIYNIKNFLSQSDYKALKFLEGQLTEEEFAPVRQERAHWREQINELEEEMNKGRSYVFTL